MRLINLEQFRAAFQSGGIITVKVVGFGGEFSIDARTVSGEPVKLATTHSGAVRNFRDAGKAIAILHRMGAHTIEVDTTAWLPDDQDAKRTLRPDTAERQRRAHEAAAHDAWFRAEVEQGLAEADDPDAEWVAEDEIKRQNALFEKELLGMVHPEKTLA